VNAPSVVAPTPALRKLRRSMLEILQSSKTRRQPPVQSLHAANSIHVAWIILR
jgi:hypothetical protein